MPVCPDCGTEFEDAAADLPFDVQARFDGFVAGRNGLPDSTPLRKSPPGSYKSYIARCWSSGHKTGECVRLQHERAKAAMALPDDDQQR